MMAMAPAQWRQQCHSDTGKDACTLTMATTSLWWGQQHQIDESNIAITTRATTLSWQLQRCLDCKDACALAMATPLRQGRQHQLDDSKDPCTLMMATTPFLQGQQHQLDDYASSKTAETPSQQGQQLLLQQQ
jgi:hypothetical protein